MKLFWRQGFRRSSVDSIAERAGLTKRTVYAYFRSKDDLLAVVMQRYEELAAERLEHIGKRLPADRVGLVDSFFVTVGRLGKHDAALVGIGVHPAGRRACGFARSSCASDCASRQGEDGIMDRRAAGRRARCERAGRAREIMLLVEGSMALTLIHGGRDYMDAAAQVAKHLVRQK